MSLPSSPHAYHGELYQYWDSRRSAGAIPSRSDIEPLDIVRVLPFVALAERREAGYFWRLIGTAIVEHFGKDHTGEPYGAHFSPPEFVAATVATFDQALEREAPFFDEFIYRSPTGMSHAVSRLVCPLKGDGARQPPMVIQTRVHRYDGHAALLPSLPDKAWGELQGRQQVGSLDDLQRFTAAWWAKAPIETAAVVDTAV
jgi:PAS domain-containing protein